MHRHFWAGAWLLLLWAAGSVAFAAGKDTSGGSQSNNSLATKVVQQNTAEGDAAQTEPTPADVPESAVPAATPDAATPASSQPAETNPATDAPAKPEAAPDNASTAAPAATSTTTPAAPATTAAAPAAKPKTPDQPDAIDNAASDVAKVVTGKESVQHEANKYETITKQAFEKYGPGSIEALAIALIGFLIARLVRALFIKFGAAREWDEAITEYLALVIFISIMTMFLISALKALGFPVNSMLASFGITGVIIGLGVRAQLNNYFAGVAMLAARPFHKGDLIEFGPPFQIGIVQNVYMSSTVLDTLDNVRIVVPNGVLWRNMIKNYSSNQERTIRFDLTIDPTLELAWVRDLASQVLVANEHILQNPAPELDVAEVTPDGVRSVLKAKCRANAVQVFAQLVEDLRQAFAEAGMNVKLPAKGVKLKVEE
ncbi:mechanosensitive ion channel family protein [Cerasicoccus fimbriatus]|uniref:mechanosensitive ion channel family protein n=1 Tax=Cerasicoccus fimbriatus TaxID=3014554 RepID=UPI0022B3C8C4|nr:mechanosensitive ion channel family protein [Cerasicoccus sp. TK19100]